MNLALLDPFRRQVPDRIDSTLSLPADLHPPRPTNRKPLAIPRGVAAPTATAAIEGDGPTDGDTSAKKLEGVAVEAASKGVETNDVNVEDGAMKQEGRSTSTQPGATKSDANTISPGKKKRANWSIPAAEDWISCHAVSFNRRGTYLAAGHLSGAVPVHDVLSRTLSTVHRPPAFGEGVESPPLTDGDVAKLKQEDAVEEQFEYRNGVTSLSWSRRSRLLLVAAVGDRNIRLVDNEHPFCLESVIGTGSDATAAGASATAAATADTASDGRVAAASPLSVVTGDADDDGVDHGAVDALDDGVSSSAQSRSPQLPPTTPSGSAAKKRKTSMDAAVASSSSSNSSTSPEQSRPMKNGAPNTTLLKYRILPPATVVDTESSSDAVSSEELQAHCRMYGLDDAIGGGDKAFPACYPVATDEEYDRPVWPIPNSDPTPTQHRWSICSAPSSRLPCRPCCTFGWVIDIIPFSPWWLYRRRAR